MIVELHIIQNFAPSNLNRDDSNTPKDCEFGGYRRARISSQCIKRSVRRHDAFKKAVQNAKGNLSVRTKRIIGKLAELIVNEQSGKTMEDALSVAEKAITLFGVKRDDKYREKTSILLYLGANELNDMVKIILDNWETLDSMEITLAVEDDSEGAPQKKARRQKLLRSRKNNRQFKKNSKKLLEMNG